MTCATPTSVPLLRGIGVRKIYGGVVTLDGVDVSFYPDEVHALMGENGAGKSTLRKFIVEAIPSNGR